MGTDIHCVFQRKDATSGRWRDVPSGYDRGRHYQLFAVLAGVRNGVGFAGMKTGEAVEPISYPRGLPDDFTNDTVWMGDHSFSWLSGEEMVAWFDSAPTVTQRGVVSREVYERWDKVSRPESYCGGVSGGGVVVVDDTEEAKRARPDWNFINVSWQSSLREELGYFFGEVRRLMGEHGEIRFVFGFDS